MRLSLIVFFTASLAASTARADDWPQYLGPKRDGVWRETGIVDQLPGEPKYLWRKPISLGYAGPAVAAGRVFITDLALGDGSALPANAFARSSLSGKERVFCLNEKTGETQWKHEYDCTYRVSYPAGPRCTPTVDGDRVYTLGAMGDLLCLDTAKGNVIWQKNLPNDFGADVPQWGFAGHPLVDGEKLIVLAGGSDGRGVVALDKKTGKQIWQALSIAGDHGYCTPIIYPIGKAGKRELIIWHPHAVVGLDPETGKRLWSQPWEIASALTAPMPRLVNGNELFLTSFYNGSLLLRIDDDKPAIVWKSKSKGNQSSVAPENTVDLHSIMPTPLIKDGYIYGVCSYGELRCLKLETGARIWETHQPITGKSERWANAFLTAQDDRCFLFNEKGELIICKLSPKAYEEVSRLKLLEPTNRYAGRPVVWTQPAFANKNCFVRNDKEIVCVSLAK